ncbi:MAG: peptidoglycan-binding protein LysM [Candidatus Tectomicrobia bacterium]|nr:peptidoglycan-binding protein LysM [Candidatus Tectomicrobia bacterium]
MDLFGFVKDVGRRVFNKDEDAAEKIQELIEANNPGVKNLGVEFDGGIVSLRGHCDSGDAHQKVVLMAGNVQGVIDVDTSNLTYDKTRPAAVSVAQAATGAVGGGDKAQSAAEPRMEFYVIQSGDTLSKLAKKYYGDAMQYPKIFEANRGVIEDADKIFVGQKIRIPLD